jgi:ribokinase
MSVRRIAVLGSLNIDHTLQVERIPGPGETVSALRAAMGYGGKGANQAVAAVRAGGEVVLLGCVGREEAGAAYVRALASEGVGTEGILAVEEATGCAFIAVDGRGENSIVVYAGANGAMSVERLEGVWSRVGRLGALLVQFECPMETVGRAVELAQCSGGWVVVNPSPWREEWRLLREGLAPVDVCVVNAHEVEAATGLGMEEVCGDGRAACAAARCRWLVVTRGGASTQAFGREGERWEVVPPEVRPVDTVGAGDAFAGALTVACLERGMGEWSLAFANTAGALATLRPGAQGAIPLRSAILAAMEG